MSQDTIRFILSLPEALRPIATWLLSPINTTWLVIIIAFLLGMAVMLILFTKVFSVRFASRLAAIPNFGGLFYTLILVAAALSAIYLIFMSGPVYGAIAAVLSAQLIPVLIVSAVVLFLGWPRAVARWRVMRKKDKAMEAEIKADNKEINQQPAGDIHVPNSSVASHQAEDTTV